MFEKLKHKNQTFSYTRLDDDEFDLRPLLIKNSESFVFNKLEGYVKGLKSQKVILDKEHHEIFVKLDDVEINFILAMDENMHTLVSITTYSLFKGITYNKLLEVIDSIKKLFDGFLIEMANN